MHSLLWQRWSCQKGEVHGDAVFPGWLAAVLLCSTVGDAGGVPPEQLVPLHTEDGGVKGKGQHVTPELASPHTPACTRVPKGNGVSANQSLGLRRLLLGTRNTSPNGSTVYWQKTFL